MTRTVLVPVDIEHPESWTGPRTALQDLFPADKADVHALYVLPAFGSSLVGSFFPKNFEERALDQARERLRDVVETLPESPMPALHVVHGDVYREILAAGERLKADMIVLKAHRPGAEDFFLGSNAARIARHARQSVLLLRD
ncbi:MAG: universal stress protein [Pseudomonadota bacterium]